MQQRWLSPDVITYNATISACEKGLKPERAMGLFDAMQQQWLSPDVITYNATISDCETGLKPEGAMGLLMPCSSSG